MIPRILEESLLRLARDYPVVTLLGPRQAGKTTLVQAAFPNHRYVNLEHPETRRLAQLDPQGFFRRHTSPLIIDEVQRVPELLSMVQVLVDERRTQGAEQKGGFILTGSHQTSLRAAISQSLAGRTVPLSLWPLSFEELSQDDASIDEYLLRGFLPQVHRDALDPTVAYRAYYQTYVERDLQQMIRVQELSRFQHFMRLCAGRIGSLLNASSLGNEIGVSYHTIEQWLSVLEASFIIVRLMPFFENFGKRFVKSPKLYFTEVGLATYLLGLENVQQISRDPLRGALFENLVVAELWKARLNRARDPHLYFIRDKNQVEVDVLFQRGRDLHPIEIKSSETFHPDFLRNLQRVRRWAPQRMREGYVIYGGNAEQKLAEDKLVRYRDCATLVV